MQIKGTLRYIVAGLLLLVFAVLTMGYSSQQQRLLVCKSLRVDVVDSSHYRFVTPHRVERYLNNRIGALPGCRMREINTYQIEELLRALPAVREVSAYGTADGDLRIRVVQRLPMFRIMARDGRSCYVDSEGKSFPLDEQYTAHVLVVNGQISLPPDTLCMADEGIHMDAKASSRGFWHDLFDFANYLYQDSFWRSLIAQVYIAREDRIELIPRVGGQIIVLGDLHDYAYKMNKLWSLYRAQLPGVGLNQYSEINLIYSNQVVCKRW